MDAVHSSAKPVDPDSPQAEHRYHTYVTHKIPFAVRLMWVGFYCLAIFYVLRYMFPAIREEFKLATPPAAQKSANPAK